MVHPHYRIHDYPDDTHQFLRSYHKAADGVSLTLLRKASRSGLFRVLYTINELTNISSRYLLGSYDKAVEVNTFFDIALPLGGIFSIPFIGLVLDNTSTLFVLSSLVTIATTIGILGVLPYEWAAYGNICLFVLYRPFYYTAVSDYAAKVFGFRTFGTVYGLTICLAGVFSFTQNGLDALMHKTFHGNPLQVNCLLLGSAFVVGVALCAFVGVRSRQIRREGLEEEAEHTRETAMPSAEVARL